MNLIIFSFLLMSLGEVNINLSKIPINENVDARFFNDTNFIKERLALCHTSHCIEELLKDIVKADHKFYDIKKNFYSLSFKKGEIRYITIELSKYKGCRTIDYVGAIKIYQAIFLCRGDINTDTLFKVNGKEFFNVSLKSLKESEVFTYGNEPSIRGFYQECKDVKIYLEIYSRAAMRGYKNVAQKIKK